MLQASISRSRSCGYTFASSSNFSDLSITEVISKALPRLSDIPYFPFHPDPLLIQAGTGAGKTTAILEAIVPFARQHNLELCVISSRAAIGLQFKRSLAHKLGQTDILSDYTPEGLRHLEVIGSVRILTYHKLWAAICSKADWLHRVGILVFDEVHALALDATFVCYTGQLLERLPHVFSHALRVYLSATPEPVLDYLLRAEGPNRLHHFHWPASYDQYRLYFFARTTEIVQKLDSLPEGDKALVFISSITEGKRLSEKLHHPSRIITADTKKEEPDVWAALLASQQLDCPITLATSTLDAGVSLTDPALKHIFCAGLNPAEVLQQAGRKRLKGSETLNLYLWSPSRKKLGLLLQHSKRIIDALELIQDDLYASLNKYILGDELPQIRRMVALTPGPTFVVNPLALEYYRRARDFLLSMLASDEEYPLDSHWSQVFGQELPHDPERWLDARYDESARTALLEWLDSKAGIVLESKQAKTTFAQGLKERYSAAFGSRKADRADRTWGLSIIKQLLCEVAPQYSLDSKNGTWHLSKSPVSHL